MDEEMQEYWQKFLDLANYLLRNHKFVDDQELQDFYDRFNSIASYIQEKIYKD